jgi:hypothetical protein
VAGAVVGAAGATVVGGAVVAGAVAGAVVGADVAGIVVAGTVSSGSVVVSGRVALVGESVAAVDDVDDVSDEQAPVAIRRATIDAETRARCMTPHPTIRPPGRSRPHPDVVNVREVGIPPVDLRLVARRGPANPCALRLLDVATDV